MEGGFILEGLSTAARESWSVDGVFVDKEGAAGIRDLDGRRIEEGGWE